MPQIMKIPNSFKKLIKKKSALGGFWHLLFWNVHTIYLTYFGVPKMVFLVFLLGGI